MTFIDNNISTELLKFITKYIDYHSPSTLILSTTSEYNIASLIEKGIVHNFINLHRLNDVRRLNKFFEQVNIHFERGDNFIGCAETFTQRRKRILLKYPRIIREIYYFVDFIIKRLFPKLSLTKKFYFLITKGRGRVLSKAELLGRLVCCGFEIVDYSEINNLLYFVVRKIKEPTYDPDPSYGPIFKMDRIGKGGKVIGVYKFRTMHPYSEYLQDYIYQSHGYSVSGKLQNDFRVTTWGKVLRKYWLDELPQLINVFMGNMKLVGGRPLSISAYKQYPANIKKMRNGYKPGCIPPYVSLLMEEMNDSIKAEEIYFNEKISHPIRTDLKYFCLAIYNIMTNKIRSI